MFSEYEEDELTFLLINASRKGFPVTTSDARKAEFDYPGMCGSPGKSPYSRINLHELDIPYLKLLTMVSM